MSAASDTLDELIAAKAEMERLRGIVAWCGLDPDMPIPGGLSRQELEAQLAQVTQERDEWRNAAEKVMGDLVAVHLDKEAEKRAAFEAGMRATSCRVGEWPADGDVSSMPLRWEFDGLIDADPAEVYAAYRAQAAPSQETRRCW